MRNHAKYSILASIAALFAAGPEYGGVSFSGRAIRGSTPNKYTPHQGAQEKARRVRNGQAGTCYKKPVWANQNA